jgi:hypothetical protein
VTWLIWPLVYLMIALEVMHEGVRFQRFIDGPERYYRLRLWERVRFPLLVGGLWFLLPLAGIFILFITVIAWIDGDPLWRDE